MKILIIDHMSALSAYRKRWHILSHYPDVELYLLIPRKWKENFTVFRYNPDDKEPFRTFSGRILFPGYENRGMYFSRIFSVVRKIRPEIILIMEEPYSFFALQTVLAKKMFAPHARLVFYTFDNLLYNFRHVHRPSLVYKAIDKFTLNNADMALCANNEAVKVLESKGFRKPSRVVYYGIDLDCFDDRRSSSESDPPSSENEEEFRIGYIGRMVEQKGLGTLIRACAKLPGRYKIILVGSGPYLDELLNVIRVSGLNDAVEYYPAVPPERVCDIMKSLDVLVLPSITTRTWKEQYGRVLIEAMASGCPVIGSDSGAIPEVIGDAGLVFHEGNEEALTAVLMEVKNNASLRESLQKAGLRRSEQFSLKKFIGEVHDACRDVMIL